MRVCKNERNYVWSARKHVSYNVILPLGVASMRWEMSALKNLHGCRLPVAGHIRCHHSSNALGHAAYLVRIYNRRYGPVVPPSFRKVWRANVPIRSSRVSGVEWLLRSHVQFFTSTHSKTAVQHSHLLSECVSQWWSCAPDYRFPVKR